MSDRPWRLRRRITVWHHDSPGVKVEVDRWLPWWRRSPFSYVGEPFVRYVSGLPWLVEDDDE